MTKVLVVEDQPSVMQIVRYHFENEGFEGVYAGDVEEAWRLLVTENPDAVVTDIALPTADGWTLIEKIRSDGRYHETPIVVLTGLQEPEVAERAKSLKCAYLTKPFAATALLNKVKTMVKENSETKAKSPSHPEVQVHRIELVPVAVVIILDRFAVEGTMYLPPELARFSDAWESIQRDPRMFFPVTHARVTSIDGGHLVAAPAFLEVSKDKVYAVFPVDTAQPPPPPTEE
jgi:DNA-binding response OmpR family regulator